MCAMNADDALNTIAARQLGFVTRCDVRTVGLSRAAMRHRIARGDWLVRGTRVLQRSGAPWTKASPLMRAVLDAGPGAVLSHGAAAAWWGLPGFDLRTLYVTRPRGLTGASVTFADRVHEVLTLSYEQVTVLDGIPIIRPERLILELCATAHPARAERALDTGWSKALYSGGSLRRIHDELAASGRAGIVLMRELLDARPPGWTPPASGLEARFMAIAKEACLGEWRRQVDLGSVDHWCGRVDFVRNDLSLIVEVQSERYHGALTDQAHDAARRGDLQAAGFTMVEVWDTQLWHRKHEVIATVREGIFRAVSRPSQVSAARSVAIAAVSAAETGKDPQ
jgi:very-short-patch-repair endonuclease